MLGYMVRGLDGVVFDTVAKPSNGKLCVASQSHISRNSVNCVFTCATFDRHFLPVSVFFKLLMRPRLAVSVEATIFGIHTFTNALAA